MARHNTEKHNTAPGAVSSPLIFSDLPLPIARSRCLKTFPCFAVLDPFPDSWVDYASFFVSRVRSCSRLV
eukprot:8291741-Pyramimonas_sp.AAC.1